MPRWQPLVERQGKINDWRQGTCKGFVRNAFVMRQHFAFLAPLLAALATPVMAQQIVIEEVVEVVEIAAPASAAPVWHAPPAPIPRGVAAFGPFRVIDGHRAALVDVTDERSPAQFSAMLRAFPGIVVLDMVECPGTLDDRGNLALGRMIRARGIATYVPRGGSVRSGAVELFLAGARRSADPAAEFAVHAWIDDAGKAPQDYPADAPENRAYLDYYREMGMSAQGAAAFYAMTNSVPFAAARWLGVAELSRWVALDSSPMLQ